MCYRAPVASTAIVQGTPCLALQASPGASGPSESPSSRPTTWRVACTARKSSRVRICSGPSPHPTSIKPYFLARTPCRAPRSSRWLEDRCTPRTTAMRNARLRGPRSPPPRRSGSKRPKARRQRAWSDLNQTNNRHVSCQNGLTRM